MPRLRGIREYITTTFSKDVIVPPETIVLPLMAHVADATTLLAAICVARPIIGHPLTTEATVRLYFNDRVVTDPLPLWLLDPPLTLPSPIRVNEKDMWRLCVEFAKPLAKELKLSVAVIGARSQEMQ
jgi:hypothetical protein